MFKNKFLTLKNPRTLNFIFLGLKFLLHLDVPSDKILLHFSVPDNQILLHFGVPGNQILLHIGVPKNCLMNISIPNIKGAPELGKGG